MPSGGSVWDVVPNVADREPAQPAAEVVAVAAEPSARPPVTPRPVAVAAPDVAIARNIEPTVPDPPVQRPSPPRRVVRRRHSALGGLVGVVTLAVAIIAAAGWFVSSGVDGADGDAPEPVTHTAPTVPAATAGAALSDLASTPSSVAAPTTIATPTTLPASAASASGEQVTVAPESEQRLASDAPPASELIDADVAPGAAPTSVPAPSTTTPPPPTPTTVPAADVESVPPPDTVLVPAVVGPRVEISARHEACRFGSNCLVVGFTLHDFEVVPGTFTCEFASGARHEFRATNATVDYACATGSIGDSITIEVAGIRSETVVNN